MRKKVSEVADKKIGGNFTWRHLVALSLIVFAIGFATATFLKTSGDSIRTVQDVQIQPGDLIVIHKDGGDDLEWILVDKLLDIRQGEEKMDIHISGGSLEDFLSETEQASQ